MRKPNNKEGGCQYAVESQTRPVWGLGAMTARAAGPASGARSLVTLTRTSGVGVEAGIGAGVFDSAVPRSLGSIAPGVKRSVIPCGEHHFKSLGGKLVMPRGDGTGPPGGVGSGMGPGRGRRMGSSGMDDTRPGAGPTGECVCPRCGARTPHRMRMPCNEVQCPMCGTLMVRR